MNRIVSAEYLTSCTGISKCPKPDKPEFAFIGRSNVGKSSLINMLTGRSKLAKTSVQPGKTRTINHFVINNSWFMADLPGYGYAKVSKTERVKFSKFINEYLTKRENLMCLFVLLDSRHGPMPVDMDFMERLGKDSIPFVRVFTKSDKLSVVAVGKNLELHDTEMLKVWESLPHTFVTSAKTGTGREDILSFIEETLTLYQQSV
ncbi:MAG: ribosome biogenesis GTP-binding protein YihA/YsxC [Bacteroidales bacterium]